MIKAEVKDLGHLVAMIKETELYTCYFLDKDLSKIVEQAIHKEEVELLVVDTTIVGLLWSDPYGTFNKYPYLHMLVVSNQHRHKGYASYMLDYFEGVLYPEVDKYFLMVAEWNKAIALYEKNGYKKVGKLPSFYKSSVDEYLMMKVID